MTSTISTHVYEVRPRKDKRGVDLISDALPFGQLWYRDTTAAVDYAKHSSRSRDVVIRVYAGAGNVIETHEHTGEFKSGEVLPSRLGGFEERWTERGLAIVPCFNANCLYAVRNGL